MDILAALIAIPLVSPIMLITAILIKLESPGPVMFLQNRVGKGNKDFVSISSVACARIRKRLVRSLLKREICV